MRVEGVVSHDRGRRGGLDGAGHRATTRLRRHPQGSSVSRDWGWLVVGQGSQV
jgi:hypothetical protein